VLGISNWEDCGSSRLYELVEAYCPKFSKQDIQVQVRGLLLWVLNASDLHPEIRVAAPELLVLGPSALSTSQELYSEVSFKLFITACLLSTSTVL
jgi:hypothetical protein